MMQNWRYEIKYVIDSNENNDFASWISSRPFLRTAYCARQINSIYLDTSSLSSADENLMGLPDRTKFRIRWYGKEIGNDVVANFEAKIKNGRLGRKVVTEFPVRPDLFLRSQRNGVTEILKNDPSVRPIISQKAPLVPILYVGYRRRYFVGPNGVRVTVDDDLRFSDVFRGGTQLYPGGIQFENSVVEFKFSPEYKDDVSCLMQGLPHYPVRISKYLLGLSLCGYVNYI